MTLPPALRRLLLIRLDNIGDVVLLSPAVAALRQRYPRTAFTLLASPAGAQAAPLLAGLDLEGGRSGGGARDDVIAHQPVWQELNAPRASSSGERELVETLEARQFDAAIVFTSFAQSSLPAAFACFLAGIPWRAGFPDRFAGRVLTHEAREPRAPIHEAERNLALLAGLGIEGGDSSLALRVPAAAQAEADRWLRAEGFGGEFVLLAPGASAPARRYPADAFAQVAREIARREGVDVAVVGSEREADLVRQVVDGAADPRVRSLGAAPSVPVLAGAVRRASAVSANNSLAIHLADAFGVPAVVTYSGTDLPERWRPRSTSARLLSRSVPCAPCHLIECDRALECLAVPPAEVAAALRDVTRAPAASVGGAR